MKCQYCSKKEPFPFKCQYCQRLFCAEHRLPENHNCPIIDQAKAPRQETQPASRFEYKVSYTPPRAKFTFSRTEIRDLTIATLLVLGVGFSFLGFDFFSFQLVDIEPMILAMLLILFAAGFLLHEIAHKIAAQHYGLWAEFRIVLFGAVLTFLSIFIPFPKFISPGAVMIGGATSKETMGKTSIVGPLANIVVGMIALTLSFVLPPELIIVAVFTTYLNTFIAVLNLIPFGILDGWKVFHWSKVIWALAFATAIILFSILLIQYGSLLGF